MFARNPRPIFDPYEWLPSYGETKVEFSTKDAELTVEIFFDSLSEGSKELKKKTLIFSDVRSFTVSSVPGVETSQIRYEGLDATGALVEFEDSEAARMWNQHFSLKENTIRHFQIWFLSANEQLEVFAKECHLLED